MKSQKVETFRRPLKHAIVDSGKTQRQIAKQTRIDETRLSRIVRGQLEPFPKEVARLSKVLGRPEGELFPSEQVPA